MATIKIELTEQDLRRLVCEEFSKRLGDVEILMSDVRIEVKSKQNYRAEWEVADFRASVQVRV